MSTDIQRLLLVCYPQGFFLLTLVHSTVEILPDNSLCVYSEEVEDPALVRYGFGMYETCQVFRTNKRVNFYIHTELGVL